MASEKKHNLGVFLFSVVFLVLAGVWGWQGYKTLAAKATQQAKAIEDFRAWKAQYTALLPIQKEWDTTFMKAQDVKDLYSLYQIISSAAETNPDRLAIEKIDRVQQSGFDIGLSRVCLMSMGDTGLVIEGSSASALLGSVTGLLNRKDVMAKEVILRDHKEKLEAVIVNFCVLVSD